MQQETLNLTPVEILRPFGALIRAIDSKEFIDRLFHALGTLVRFDSSLVLIFRHGAPPVLLHEALNAEERDIFRDQYLRRGYMVSPYYQRWRRDRRDMFGRLQDIVSDDFTRSADFDYYLNTGLADELAYTVALDHDAAVFIWIGINDREFSTDEINALRQVQPVVFGSAFRNWVPVSRHFVDALDPYGGLHQQLERALDHFGRSVLTEREATIAQLILKGYSTQTIAERLQIAAGTVKNHRNHIYEKLDIASQGELFALFLSSVAHPHEGDADDPLSGYLPRSSHR